MRALLLGLLVIPAATAQPSVVVREAFPGLRFSRPVAVQAEAGRGAPHRYFVVEQGGAGDPSQILTVQDGDPTPAVFLDLSDRVEAGGEAGLLGLAFHPDYADNGRLFVYYTAPVTSPEFGVRVLESRVSEFARSTTDPLQADPASEQVILRVDQPNYNHNGGTVRFGPDGYLYLGLGDGGGDGDPYANGQDVTTLLGTILRIDVDDVPAGAAYGIPPDNPFAATGGPERDEIYAYGFRNPFKFSVSTAGLWVADVGNTRYEEVDLVQPGTNYGWNEVEGPACYPNADACDLDAYEPPVLWYGHDAQGGQSITGGFVVANSGTSLDGYYLYGDYISGRMWAYDIEAGGAPTVLFERVPTGSGGTRPINISSIDEGHGRVLVSDYGTGTIYELIPAGTAAETVRDAALAVSLAGANPFRTRTALAVRAAGAVRVALVDALGREVARLWDGPAPDRIEVEGRALAPGVYTLVVRTATESAALRLVRLP